MPIDKELNAPAEAKAERKFRILIGQGGKSKLCRVASTRGSRQLEVVLPASGWHARKSVVLPSEAGSGKICLLGRSFIRCMGLLRKDPSEYQEHGGRGL